MSNSNNHHNNKDPIGPKNKNPNPPKDPSNNDTINPFLWSLHGCNNGINTRFPLLPSINNLHNNQRDLNDNKHYFNMTFNSIMEEIRKNRLDNKQKINSSYSNFTKTLDASNNAITLLATKNTKSDNLEDFLKHVTDKYNLLHDIKNVSSETNTVLSRLNNNYRPRSKTIYSSDFEFPSNSFSLGAPKLQRYPYPITHKLPPPLPPIVKKKITINREINGLEDILKLIKDYPLKRDVEYNIDMKVLHNIKKPLGNLNAMIGMTKLKDSIVDQIIYFLQGLDRNNDFMHTVIYGPPGTGKTEVAKIMGSIFSSLGILTNNTFKKVTRADLIAGYLGQTAMKTKDVVKESLGGVLFIDEAYALGNSEKKDSFAKECIDTLCEALSDHKSKLMVIIAGYEIDLKKCFFAYNQGLDSRFPWRFHTDDYTPGELKKIFIKKIKDINWSMTDEIGDEWFKTKMEYFKFYGRDMETLLAKTKIAHGRRVFCKSKDVKTIITKKDLDKGFEMFLSNNEVRERKKEGLNVPFMYI